MNKLYVFSKSETEERDPTPGLCSVARIDTGNRLLVPEHALIPLKGAAPGQWVTDDKMQAEVAILGAAPV